MSMDEKWKEKGCKEKRLKELRHLITAEVHTPWLDTTIKKVYLEGYEKGYEEGSKQENASYEDGYNQGTCDTERRIASEL